MLRNITLFFAIIFLIGCGTNNENGDQLLNTIGESLCNEISSEKEELQEKMGKIKALGSSYIGPSQFKIGPSRFKKLTTLDSSIQAAIKKVMTWAITDYGPKMQLRKLKNEELEQLKESLIESSNLIDELLLSFRESSAVMNRSNYFDTRLKNYFDFTSPKLNSSEKKVALLNEILRLTKLTHESIDLVMYTLEGDGMIVNEILPIVAVLPEDLKADKNLTASVLLTAVNKNMSPQFYVGEFDNTKVDDSKPFTWSKSGEFKSPPLKKGYTKLKSIDGIGKTSLDQNNTITGVYEMLTERGPIYLPFTSKGQSN